MTKCPAIYHPYDTNPTYGCMIYPCILDEGHDGNHEPMEDPIPYIPSDLPSADDLHKHHPEPEMAGSFALYPYGNAMFGVLNFDVPEDGGQIRGPVPKEFVEMFRTGKKPSAMQMAKMAMAMLAG